MNMRRIVRLAVVLTVAVWILPLAEASAQQEVGIYAFGGVGSTPGDFDAFRQVDYGSAPLVGAGFSYTFSPLFSLRGDVSWVQNSGDETELVQESVDFSRAYFATKLQLRYELDGGLAPYVYGGGGIVSISRDAPSYSYDFNEVAGTLGLGLQYDLAGSRLGLFAEGEGWFYNRNTVEGSQFDKAAVAGLKYSF